MPHIIGGLSPRSHRLRPIIDDHLHSRLAAKFKSLTDAEAVAHDIDLDDVHDPSARDIGRGLYEKREDGVFGVQGIPLVATSHGITRISIRGVHRNDVPAD